MSNVLFYDPFYNFDRFFDQMSASRGQNGTQTLNQEERGSGASRPFKPRMDLHEDTEKNVVTATFELPGVNKQDVQLDLRDGVLTVTAELRTSTEHDERGFAIRERRYGKYSRSLKLPQGIMDQDVKASMTDGILTVTFPKTTPEQEAKRITIA